jgi:hypothetical protein
MSPTRQILDSAAAMSYSVTTRRSTDDEKSTIGRLAGEVGGLLMGFHPERKPVLWRVLVAQHRLYQAFLGTLTSEDGSPTLDPVVAADFRELNWRKTEGDVVEEDVRTTLIVADAYVRELIKEKVRVPGRTQATHRGTRLSTLAGSARARRRE